MKYLLFIILLISILPTCLGQTLMEDSLAVSGDSLLKSFTIQYFRNGYLLSEKEFRDDKLVRLLEWKTSDTLVNKLYSKNGTITCEETFYINSRSDSSFTGYNEDLYFYFLFFWVFSPF